MARKVINPCKLISKYTVIITKLANYMYNIYGCIKCLLPNGCYVWICSHFLPNLLANYTQFSVILRNHAIALRPTPRNPLNLTTADLGHYRVTRARSQNHPN